MRRILLPLYRIRGIVLAASVIAILAALLVRSVWGAPAVGTMASVVSLVAVVGMVSAFALALSGSRIAPRYAPMTVLAPVSGRWLAVNSPATKVPSHGVRGYGQAYAIDLVYETDEEPRPEFGSGDALKRPEEFPAYGRPVRAMCDGVVVRAWDRLRDHRSRSSYPALALLALEGMLRELGGPRFIVGNHVVIRSDDGRYALVAHLRHGSVGVARGERVSAGQVIAACGNTGNTTEPHVHAQLMDRASVWTAQGVPLLFRGVRIDDEAELRDAVPADGEHLVSG